jgi:hypothetical protein
MPNSDTKHNIYVCSSAVMLNDVILSVALLSSFMLGVVMLSIEMLIVVMLSVLATQNREQHN